jgi:MFS family permease
MNATDARTADADVPTASPAYRAYVVWLLFLVAVFNFFDRQIVNILAEPIKHDLGLADWQLGMLTGLSFAALYTIAGIPIAVIADRTNRARIISGALLLWSIFTAVCGLTQTFTQLFMARVAVGLAESGCQPPSVSLISDYAPKEKRSSALGHYSVGIAVGGLVALAAGGVLADRFGWRAAFLIAGAPGIVLAVVAALTLKDPRARRHKGSAAAPSRPVRECLRELAATNIFWWLCLASASKGMISYGQGAFLGSFFLRVHKAGLADVSATIERWWGLHLGPLALVGLGLGLISGMGGVFGTWLGGHLGDRFARRNMTTLLLIPAVAAPLAAPFHLAAFMAPSAWMALLLLIPPGLLGAMWLGPTFAALQSVVRPDTRATAAAVQASFVLFLGLGLGPLVVGLLSDTFAGPLALGPAEGVRWALVVMSGMGLVAGVLFYVASTKLKAAIIS